MGGGGGGGEKAKIKIEQGKQKGKTIRAPKTFGKKIRAETFQLVGQIEGKNLRYRGF